VDDLIVVVAAGPSDADLAASDLRGAGALRVWRATVGERRVLVYGAPFGSAAAVDAASTLRAAGWPADVRPTGGGHLAAWRSHTRPTVVDERLWVGFPWSEAPRPDDPSVLVEIDPLGAFGTGTHPSTRLLLQQLVRRVSAGQSVLDVGSGSGVLAVAAARLGAGRVDATDISPPARAATQRNAERNGVDVSTSTELPLEEYDVVLANIAASTLVALAPAIEARVRRGGWVGLSGISPAQESVVAAAFRRLEVVEVTAEDDWVALVLSSGAPRPPRPRSGRAG
jgi:2-polyprenyl-3-methyl-5-hydroxy-6-metoxy-1,4-benzoquinol methylase